MDKSSDETRFPSDTKYDSYGTPIHCSAVDDVQDVDDVEDVDEFVGFGSAMQSLIQYQQWQCGEEQVAQHSPVWGPSSRWLASPVVSSRDV